MARNKNALRQHFIQPYVKGEEYTEDGWLELAEYISNIGLEPNEETETEAFYSGDGTPEETVVSVARGYTPEGYFDPENEAQALIESLQDEVGDDRKVWHKIIRSDGKKQWVGRATVLNIVAGAGEAQNYEDFSCTIRFDEKPEVEDLGNGDGGGGGVEG